jgi:hypothetical protein
MKRVLYLLPVLIVMLVITGCEKEKVREEAKKGNYKEGTYFGYAYDKSYDAYASAVIYVDSNGMIKSVFIDSTYINKNKSATTTTTKKITGDEYGMKKVSATKGKIEGGAEWYEQMNDVEKYVIDNQGINITLDDTGHTDAISGATINLAPTYEALTNALNQAK